VPATRLPAQLSQSRRSHRAMAGFKGKKNGELLLAAEMAGYDVLLTVDQSIPDQQHSASRKLSIMLIRSRTNQIADLLPLADAILKAVTTITPGQIVPIP
jgi:hypothetical protein